MVRFQCIFVQRASINKARNQDSFKGYSYDRNTSSVSLMMKISSSDFKSVGGEFGWKSFFPISGIFFHLSVLNLSGKFEIKSAGNKFHIARGLVKRQSREMSTSYNGNKLCFLLF